MTLTRAATMKTHPTETSPTETSPTETCPTMTAVTITHLLVGYASREGAPRAENNINAEGANHK
jgi:hypothetical protein